MAEKSTLADDADFILRLRVTANLIEEREPVGAGLLREAAAMIESLWSEIDQISADLDEANERLLEAEQAAWDSPR